MWGMLGLGDQVKAKVRGGRKDAGRVVSLPDDKTATVEYDDGERVNVPIANARKTRGK